MNSSKYRMLEPSVREIKDQFLKLFESKKEDSYLQLIDDSDDRLDFRIGFQRFTLAWSVSSSHVLFQTFHWHYDANTLTRYIKEPIKAMEVLISCAGTNPTALFLGRGDQYRDKPMKDFSALYFDALEFYIDKHLDQKEKEYEAMKTQK